MNKITRFFVNRRALFWSFMAIILLLGFMYYKKMPKLEDPAVAVKQASVVVIYPGAESSRVERDVVRMLEEDLQSLPDIRRITSTVKDGQALINVEFTFETPGSELEQHFDLLRRKVNDASMKLPQGCMTPIVVDDMMDVYGIFYALSGEDYEYDELEKYAKALKREILSIDGVKRVNIGGTQREVIDIAFTPEQLRNNGMLPMLVAQALQSSTKAINGGKIDAGEDRMSVRITEGASDVQEIANVMLTMPDGKKVRLGDIAKVSRHEAVPQSGAFFLNGRPALTVMVAMEASAVVPDVGAEVDRKVEAVVDRFPAGLNVEKVFFQPEKVETAVSSFIVNLLESVLIVVIVLMLSMGWRSGIIIGFGLVLTVALSFPILSALGSTLQRISLGAFIIAMGMLVDNAVVIMDGIMKDRRAGLPQTDYLYRIGRQTAMPLLGATIIAAATFLPIYLVTGTVGEFAGDLFIVVCVSLLVSWFLALIQVPACSAAWLKPISQMPTEVAAAMPLNGLQRFIKRIVIFLIRHKWVSAFTAFGLLAVAGYMMTHVKNIFFPDFDYNQYVVECYFPPQSNPEAVRDCMFAMSDTLMADKDVQRVAINMGGAPGRYCLVRPMPIAGDNYAEFIVDCTDHRAVDRLTKEMTEKLRRMSPQAYIRARKYNFSISSSHKVEVEFSGPDPAVLRRLSAQAESIMLVSPYVDPYTVQNNWELPSQQLSLAYSAQSAARAGVNRADVGNALMAANDGYTVGVISDNDNLVPINLVIRESNGEKVGDLSAIPVWTTLNVSVNGDDVEGLMNGSVTQDEITDKMFRTTSLAACIDSMALVWDESIINRYNGQRVIQAECDPDPFNPDATPDKLMRSVKPAIEQIQLPPGYAMRWVGESELSDEAMGDVFSNVPVMIVILVLVLLLLFNSWKKLAIILLCFPFVLCGIVPALLITGTPFTFLAILGLMGLMGMIIKNAIVLVDEINLLNETEHIDLYSAIVNATLSRVRPVMLASITTMAGMIPLVSDPMYGPLAVTVIGGLFVGTIVTLLFLPILYSLFFKVKPTRNED